MAHVHKGFTYLYFLHKTAIRLIESKPELKAVDLAKALHIRPGTAGEWIKIYKTEGAYALLSREPGRRKLTSVQINFVRQSMRKHPSEFGLNDHCWNIEAVEKLIIQQFEIAYDDNDTLRRTLKLNGVIVERKNKAKNYEKELDELFEIIEVSSPSDYGLEGKWTLETIYLIACIQTEISLTQIPLYKRLKQRGWISEYMQKSKTAK